MFINNFDPVAFQILSFEIRCLIKASLSFITSSRTPSFKRETYKADTIVKKYNFRYQTYYKNDLI